MIGHLTASFLGFKGSKMCARSPPDPERSVAVLLLPAYLPSFKPHTLVHADALLICHVHCCFIYNIYTIGTIDSKADQSGALTSTDPSRCDMP